MERRRTRLIVLALIILVCIVLSGCTPEKEEKKSRSAKESVTNEATEQEVTIDEDKQEVLPGPDPATREKAGTPGLKTITIMIKGLDGAQDSQVITTEAGDLLTAVESTGIAQSSPEDYGYILTVGGYTANLLNGEWWQISKNGTYLQDSADQTAIEDGDTIIFDLQKLN